MHHANTPLHLAFSCYVFDEAGRLLITRRALNKPTFPGVWTNTVCGHPAPDEAVEQAVHRRAKQELGITLRRPHVVLPDFRYEATMANGVRENEICPVFTAVTSDEPEPDVSEVAATEWVPWELFRDGVLTGHGWSRFGALSRSPSWPPGTRSAGEPGYLYRRGQRLGVVASDRSPESSRQLTRLLSGRARFSAGIYARPAPVAQWIEQPPPKRKVASSTLAWGTTRIRPLASRDGRRHPFWVRSALSPSTTADHGPRGVSVRPARTRPAPTSGTIHTRTLVSGDFCPGVVAPAWALERAAPVRTGFSVGTGSEGEGGRVRRTF